MNELDDALDVLNTSNKSEFEAGFEKVNPPALESEKLGGQNHPTLDADQDTRDQLKQFTDAILSLEDEKDMVAGQIRTKFKEAKALGFDTKVLRKVVKELRRSEADRQEEFRLMEMYLNALGVFW